LRPTRKITSIVAASALAAAVLGIAAAAAATDAPRPTCGTQLCNASDWDGVGPRPGSTPDSTPEVTPESTPDAASPIWK